MATEPSKLDAFLAKVHDDAEGYRWDPALGSGRVAVNIGTREELICMAQTIAQPLSGGQIAALLHALNAEYESWTPTGGVAALVVGLRKLKSDLPTIIGSDEAFCEYMNSFASRCRFSEYDFSGYSSWPD